ncbi:MAG: zinc ABC transporter substrate-binding protein [Opitutaceae bacterium]|nr:zinc ABC transporter substrate-binding protein [Opitutaceae bacterium]
MKSAFAAGLLSIFALTTVGRAAERPVVVVTTTLLATAVNEMAGDSVKVHTLMPGGTCPGSFDLTPADARLMAQAVLFFRHEFQGALDRPARAAGLPAEAVVAPPSGGALTIPSVYAGFCARLAEPLGAKLDAAARARIEERLQAIATRASEASQAALARTTALQGRPVLVAQFQADFVRWLGLATPAIYPPGDDPSARVLAHATELARRCGVVAIVGNLQNGRRAPDALGELLRMPVIMLSNFPPDGQAGAYWRMLDANVQALQEGVKW